MIYSEITWKKLRSQNIRFERSRLNWFLSNLLQFKAKIIYYRHKFFFHRRSFAVNDVSKIFVYQSNTSSILKKITDNLTASLPSKFEISPICHRICVNDTVFFEHYLPYCHRFYMGLIPKNTSIVWFTHLRQHSFNLRAIVQALDNARFVVFQCQHDYELFNLWGLTVDSVVLNGAVDATWKYVNLKPYSHTSYDFLVSSNNYPRKNPDLYKKLIIENPDRKFCFLGKGWGDFKNFGNVDVVDCNYRDYPQFYKKSKVFLSLSYVEGGPLSVCEALQCGLPVVMTATGIYRELQHNPNVLIVDENSIPSIDKLLSFAKTKRGIRTEQPTWEQFGSVLAGILEKHSCSSF